MRNLLFGLCIIIVGLTSQVTVANAAPPNILVCIADDVSWRDLGCYGNPGIRTPTLDRLAANGLLFENAFLTTSSCSPSRISILSGKYPHATGAEDLHMPLPAEELFLTTPLTEAGYVCGHMQKTHYGPNGNKQFQWYSRNLGDFPKFLDESGDKPFFMWVGFSDAHRPYKPNAIDNPHQPDDVTVPPYLVDDESTRKDLALYYDEISRMDSVIGEMAAELKERGKLENTLIVFLADNGMPFPRAKGTVYDSGIGTPLMMHWPAKLTEARREPGLTSVIDLAPTFLDVAGLKAPASMQGRSLRPVLEGESNAGRKYIFAERNWHNCDEHMRCVRSDRYKLITNAYLDQPFGHPADCSSCPSWESLVARRESGDLTNNQGLIFRAPRPAVELYDLQADPHEFNNLADDPEFAAVRQRLLAALDDWREQTGDFPASQRTRGDNTNRVTGKKFTGKIPPLENVE